MEIRNPKTTSTYGGRRTTKRGGYQDHFPHFVAVGLGPSTSTRRGFPLPLPKITQARIPAGRNATTRSRSHLPHVLCAQRPARPCWENTQAKRLKFCYKGRRLFGRRQTRAILRSGRSGRSGPESTRQRGDSLYASRLRSFAADSAEDLTTTRAQAPYAFSRFPRHRITDIKTDKRKYFAVFCPS